MPKCKHCPIQKECNKNPIYGLKPVNHGQKIVMEKERLCPLVLLLASFIKHAKKIEGEKHASAS